MKATPVVELGSQGVKIASIQLKNLKLEFVAPLGADSPISRFLENRGGGLHHIAFETTQLEKDAQTLKTKGVRTLSESPSIGYDGTPIIFLHPKDTRGVLIELEEAEKK